MLNNFLCVTPDGRRAISPDLSRTGKSLLIWDTRSGRELRNLQNHSGSITSVAVLPDNRRIISGSDNTLHLWDIETGDELKVLPNNPGQITAIIPRTDGHSVIAAAGQSIIIWDFENNKKHLIKNYQQKPITATALTHDNQKVITASSYNPLIIRELNNKASVVTNKYWFSWEQVPGIDEKQLLHYLNKQFRMYFNELISEVKKIDEKTIIISNWEDCVKIILDEHNEQVTIVTRYGQTLNLSVKVENDSLKIYEDQKIHKGTVLSVAVLPDGCRFISRSNYGTLKVWDLTSGQELLTIGNPHESIITSFTVTKSGEEIIIGYNDGSIEKWNLDNGNIECYPETHNSMISDVLIISHTNYFVSVSTDRTIKLLDLESKEVIATFITDRPLSACAVSPDGLTIIAGDASGIVHFLRLEGGKS